MIPVDLRNVPDDALLHAEVCIIGSGPAGSVLAEALAERFDVILLESGGLSEDETLPAEILSIGAPRVMDQRLVRNRVIGGSSTTWWGRAAMFDEMDFAFRPWVPHSGWPIDRTSLAEWIGRAAGRLRLGADDNTLPGAVPGRAAGFDPDRLVDYRWTYSRAIADSEQPVRFDAEDLRRTRARVLVQATATHLITDAAGRHVVSVEVRDGAGRTRTIDADRVVLAAGGIENARLLLASNRQVPSGVGNRCDQVGRYLMDHLRGPVGSYEPSGFVALQRTFGSYRARTDRGRFRVVPGAALAPAVQQKEGLLQAAMWIEGPISEDDPARLLGRLRRRPSAAVLAELLGSAPLAAWSAARSRLGRSSIRIRSGMDLVCMVEQAPDPRSRIRLGDQLDPQGMPTAVIDWRFGEAEARTARRASAIFATECARLGVPVPALDPMMHEGLAPFSLPDVAHPTGTTRMSDRPEYGVVDTDCRVHGVDNLFVAGSSVFPTSGHANPTQLIIALALRLAEHLRTT